MRNRKLRTQQCWLGDFNQTIVNPSLFQNYPTFANLTRHLVEIINYKVYSSLKHYLCLTKTFNLTTADISWMFGESTAFIRQTKIVQTPFKKRMNFSRSNLLKRQWIYLILPLCLLKYFSLVSAVTNNGNQKLPSLFPLIILSKHISLYALGKF